MLLKSSLAAILIGVAHYFFIAYRWGHSLSVSPALNWVVSIDVSFLARKLMLYSLEFIAHVLLSFPAAFAICKLKPKKHIQYLILAILPSFIWINSQLILHPISVIDLQPWDVTLKNFVYGLTAIPVSFFIIHLVATRSNRAR